MNKNSKTVIVIGIIVLAIIIYFWIMKLKQVELWFGDASEMVSNLRAGITHKYGLRAILTIAGTGGLAYIINNNKIFQNNANTNALNINKSELENELTRLKNLKDEGILTEEEYKRKREETIEKFEV
ncbi:hypothetical protein Amet_4679 [Alkaliphilus metalliredigens QYMF]|uniref:SHOCT domain-containing protein n=1 Tax=Alkaliphilus metalliredigens (strain QYMF) TaxID=293826 RepID=A6TX29_ALKMQ|nr:SHOCT domain-containing protein [Alkaliphilus metalliredigens]ABR50747.1 hypothetical protein Amet_4679 [Alkaliphilus metalliredigens QYMF]